MPITPFLRHQAFDPIQIDLMGKAFKDACASLGLNEEADDSATRLVATHIIELAQRGIVNADELFDATMREFRPNPAQAASV
jgi:hypothetical protein